jgi:hypothetical protein
VLSTYAVGALGGTLAGSTWLIPVAIIWSSLSPDDLPAPYPLVALSPIAGLLYVELIWWLPPQRVRRMFLFGLVAAASIGVLAAAIVEPTPTWITMLLALAIGASVPPAARGVVWAFTRSITSVMALRPGQSIPVLFLVTVIVASVSESLLEVARAAPALTAAFALSIVGLGPAIWTVGMRPVDEWPRWFRLYGPLTTVFLMTVGIVSAWR